MNTRNFIRYQYVDVSSETSRNAFAFRDELSSVCTYNLLPELERLLDEVDIGESTLLFDKIEIDAGEIPQENWESVFVTKVIERLRQEIMERIASKRWDSQTEPSYLRELTGVEKRRRTILDFMHSGVLDWSADIKSDSDFEQALDRWIETDVEGVDELIRCTSDTKGFLDRLTSQCNDKVLDKILVGVTGMSAESIQAARKALSALLLNSTTKVYPIRFLINQILFTSLKGKKVADLEEFKVTLANTSLTESGRSGTEPLPAEFHDFFSGIDLSKSTYASAQLKDDALLRHNVRSIKDRLLTEEGYYINNAGLVLLAPFLERLFENVGYVEGKKWKSKETQQRAIGLLHFIVTGDIVFREYNLLLNKIVVGYEVHQSLPYDLILSDFEKQEGLDVLTSIIEHWKALKNTSVDGLRTGFLQREGKLCAMPDEWHLKVQQLTLDILLDRLPWGYSVVKTPWMSKMLKVEWA